MLNTIGYESADLFDFVETLKKAEINLLVDVRDRAQSRRRGFSKTALAEAVNEAGIEYLHLRQLGDPKEGREAARAGQWEKFHRIYEAVMQSDLAQDAIALIQSVCEQKNVCLLCYERDHTTCHRKCISDELERRLGEKTRHLGVRKFSKAA